MPPELSVQVLRNLGIPVQLAEVGQSPTTGRYEPLMGDDGPILKSARIKFDANAIADLEERYGSLDGYEEVTNTKAFVGVRTALAVLFNVRKDDGSYDDEKAGAMIPDGEAPRLAVAIMSALGMANGVDPTQIARMYQIGLKQEKEGRERAMEALEERLDFAEHPEQFREVERDGEMVLERLEPAADSPPDPTPDAASSPEGATSPTSSAPGTSATTPTGSPEPGGRPTSPTTSSPPPPASSPSTAAVMPSPPPEPSPSSEPLDQTPEPANLIDPTPEQVEARPFTVVKTG